MPPQHSITAIPTFVCSEAFDWTPVADERSRMPDGGNAHPLVIYFAGESRYDLDAAYPVPDREGTPVLRCAREYLKPGHGFPEWKLRKLRAVDAARCTDLGGETGRLSAFALAAGDKSMTESEVDALVAEHGLTAICRVGEAALRASSAPKVAEKKL